MKKNNKQLISIIQTASYLLMIETSSNPKLEYTSNHINSCIKFLKDDIKKVKRYK